MPLTFEQCAHQLTMFANNVNQEVPKHAVKGTATAFKSRLRASQKIRSFHNFGSVPGGSDVGVGVHFKMFGSGGAAYAIVSTYGPFGILEEGTPAHVILPKAGRGVIGSRTRGQIGPSKGRARTRSGARGLVEGRLGAGKGFRSLEGGSVLAQHALKIGDRYTPYAKVKGVTGSHPWAKAVSSFSPIAGVVFQRSLEIGLARTVRG